MDLEQRIDMNFCLEPQKSAKEIGDVLKWWCCSDHEDGLQALRAISYVLGFWASKPAICPKFSSIYLMSDCRLSPRSRRESALFWVVTQRVVVSSKRHFETIYWSSLEGSTLDLNMRQIGCPGVKKLELWKRDLYFLPKRR